MRQYNVALEKYWETQSGYFRLATTVALGTDIADGKLLRCHGVAEGNVDMKISTSEYNNRTVYECFNNPFTDELGSPDLNLPLITFDDSPQPYKRARYNPGMLPATIYVALENSFSTFITPYDSLDILPSDDTNTIHVMKTDVLVLGRLHIEYCCRKHDKKMPQKEKVLLLHMI